MRFDRPLDEVLRSRSSIRVLRALFELPEGMAVSARDVARRAGISHPTSAAALRALLAQGLVLVQRSPGSEGFRLNRDHVLAPALSVLFEREQGLDQDLEEFIRGEIEGRHLRLRGALLFGSAKDRRASGTSDIDLAVLCRSEEEEDIAAVLEDVADAVRLRYGNRLNVIFGTKSLGRLTAGPGSRLWKKILEEGRPIIPVNERRSRRA